MENHTAWKLPPLILHPFAGERTSDRLLEGSKAALMLHGLMPNRELDSYELQKRVLDGRYQEVRMLFFLGKDLLRWIDQCVDYVKRQNDPILEGIREQSFAMLLAESPPDSVTRKMQQWGVSDQKAIFSRAIGLNTIFAELPSSESLAPTFLLNYHRFADHFFICYQHLAQFTPIASEKFPFEMYASAEYSKILENQWQDSAGT